MPVGEKKKRKDKEGEKVWSENTFEKSFGKKINSEKVWSENTLEKSFAKNKIPKRFSQT